MSQKSVYSSLVLNNTIRLPDVLYTFYFILFVTNITAGCVCFAVAGYFFLAFRNVELIGEFSKLYLNVDMISNMALFQDQAKGHAGTMEVIPVSDAGSQHQISHPTLHRIE